MRQKTKIMNRDNTIQNIDFFDKNKGCLVKKAFLSREKAEETAAKWGNVFKVYECKWCGLFHIGHKGYSNIRVIVEVL